MIIGLVVVSVVVGIIVGWWLTITIATVAMSYSQERMQRRVRYWQAETALVRAKVRAGPPPRHVLMHGGRPRGHQDRNQVE